MKKVYLFAAAALLPLLSLALSVPAEAKGKSKNVSTQEFINKTANTNAFEIASSKIALEKSQNEDIRALAQQMIDDHSEADKEFQQALSSSSANLSPASGGGVDSKHQKILDQLKSASGAEFDRQYINELSKGHKDAVALYQGYSQNGENAALKEYAAKTLPTLEKHKEHVEAIKSKS